MLRDRSSVSSPSSPCASGWSAGRLRGADESLGLAAMIGLDLDLGALNFTNGETVAVKQIQLSNIPKAELGEIMVSRGKLGYSCCCVRKLTSIPSCLTVRDRSAQESQCRLCLVLKIEYRLLTIHSLCSPAPQYRQIQGFRQDQGVSIHHPRVRLSLS